MAWVAVNENGTECIYSDIPERANLFDLWVLYDDDCDSIVIPQGSIEKLIGRKLTWEDEPIELK